MRHQGGSTFPIVSRILLDTALFLRDVGFELADIGHAANVRDGEWPGNALRPLRRDASGGSSFLPTAVDALCDLSRSLFQSASGAELISLHVLPEPRHGIDGSAVDVDLEVQAGSEDVAG